MKLSTLMEIFFWDPIGKLAGEVLLDATSKKGMVWQRGRELKKENIEAIWIEVYFKHSKSLLLCNVYRSHDNSKYLDSNFEAYFDKMLSESVRECSRGQRNIFTWRHKC